MIASNKQNTLVRGRSLVELMIVIAISLLLMFALLSIYNGSKQTFRVVDEKSRLDEDGRLALNLIAFHLRMAGYGSLISADPKKKTIYTNFLSPANAFVEGLEGCSGGFANASVVAYVCNNSAGADAVIVRYVVDTLNANNTAANLPADCLGQGVIISPSVVENRFFIATNPSTSLPELYCIGNGGSASTASNFSATRQPIAENVTDMKITYGYDSNGDQSVDGFFPASAISTLSMPTLGTQWSNVVSVKVCLIVRSANDGIATTPQQYRNCSDAVVTATDRRLYSVFSTVITLRSRATGSTL
jgi:type IV pilus assembly protein PilW